MSGPLPTCQRRRPVRLALIVPLAALVLLVGALPAGAQADGDGDDTRVVVTGRVEVASDERTGDVVIFDGPALIAGSVNGAVVAFNGDVRVQGEVEEDVVVFRGRAIVEDGATVGGDVVSSKAPRVDEGATVGGDVERVNFANIFQSLGWVLWFAWWVAVSISVLVLGILLLLLAPRVPPRVLEAGRDAVGPAIGWGLAVAVGLPIVCLLLAVTLVGIPLALIGLLSLALLFGLGYVSAALLLGRRLIREPSSLYLAYVVGFVILRIVDLIPVLGNLVTAAATVYGLGALTVAAWRAAHRPAVAPPPAAEPATTGVSGP